jgi:membrane protease YdiL (CAAX protease family)
VAGTRPLLRHCAGPATFAVRVIDILLALLGYDVDPSLLAERAPAYLVTLGFVAVLGGGLEEPGWRGFALPRLERRYTPVVAT